MNEVSYRCVEEEEAGQRLDNYLIRILKGVPKSHIYRMIRGGEVRVNKKRAKPDTRILHNDLIRIPPVRISTEKEKSTLLSHQRHRLQTCILYEDDLLLVINKPIGFAVHGGSGLNLGVIEALRQMRPDLHYLELVHRLDKETSGCLLLAKKRSALRAIQASLTARQVSKVYWAILQGPWADKKKLEVDVPLLKNIVRSGERVVRVNAEGKPSKTQFHLLENFKHACWLEVKPLTGRTHQIRVHSLYLGHPILGDEKYNLSYNLKQFDELPRRLYLHARSIEFNLNGKQYQFSAELDESFKAALTLLRNQKE